MKNGFTLIELMIVAAIIGILIAVIVPAITTSRNNDGSLCRYGLKYDISGNQLIGQNGGGIQCDLQSSSITNK